VASQVTNSSNMENRAHYPWIGGTSRAGHCIGDWISRRTWTPTGSRLL